MHANSQNIGLDHQISAVLQSKNSLKTVSNEEMIVPALSMKKPIDFNTVGDDDFDPGK